MQHGLDCLILPPPDSTPSLPDQSMELTLTHTNEEKSEDCTRCSTCFIGRLRVPDSEFACAPMALSLWRYSFFVCSQLDGRRQFYTQEAISYTDAIWLTLWRHYCCERQAPLYERDLKLETFCRWLQEPLANWTRNYSFLTYSLYLDILMQWQVLFPSDVL